FSDLVDSTALSARMDPEDLREVISAYQSAASAWAGRQALTARATARPDYQIQSPRLAQSSFRRLDAKRLVDQRCLLGALIHGEHPDLREIVTPGLGELLRASLFADFGHISPL